jgi:hypothetical protein
MTLPAQAQQTVISCGDAPKDVPLMIQEQLKGDAEGKAQALTKMLGSAQIRGNIDTSRMELQEEHKNLDQHQIDMYYLWVSCQAIMADKGLSIADKMRLWAESRTAFSSPTPSPATVPPPARDPNALYQYGEAVANVQGPVISQSSSTVTFQAVRTTGKADPTRDVEFQDWVLRCPDLPRPPPNAIVGQFIGVVAGETCSIIRKRS